MLATLHQRLAGVTIERLPFAEVIRRYDGAETLFYLDPPYSGGERYYGAGLFERADFERLAVQLAGIAGEFILSINDTPGVRELFADFAIEAVGTSYTSSNKSTGSAKPVTELIVRNRR